ncbi:MAG: diaminopropionate ammonia-lyase [Chthoniobacterales bacterium]
MTARVYYHARRESAPFDSPDRGPLAFHRRLEGYAPTPLSEAPEIARLFGVERVLLKVEAERLGLPAFKILGASWAIYRTLQSRLPELRDDWTTTHELAARVSSLRPLTLVTATDGNHGRAVAHIARRLGFDARIYLPAHTAKARLDGIASEGAQVRIVDGTYDDAVARSARDASERCLVISDTSWAGYEEVPRWVMEGYSTIFCEIDDELARRNQRGPDLTAVQTGVGALAAAVVQHYRLTKRDPHPVIVNVEPLHAACMLAAMEAGEIVTVPGPHDSIMAGLNCGRASTIAWPIVSKGVDAFIAVDDDRAREAMRLLGSAGVAAGETGAAGLAGLLELLTGVDREKNRAALRVNEKTCVLILVTEGATDPKSYAEIVGTFEPTRTLRKPSGNA